MTAMTKSRLDWAMKSAALVVPFTAILHHAIFFRSNCILNPFGADYTLQVIATWFMRDPSLPWAIVASVVVHSLGNHRRFGAGIQGSTVPFLVAFLPLSLWLWDIPGLGRPICMAWHDARLVLPGIGIVRTKHLYLLGGVIFLSIQAARLAIGGMRIKSRLTES